MVGAGGLALGLGLLTSRLLADDRPPARRKPSHGRSIPNRSTPNRSIPNRSATHPARRAAKPDGSSGAGARPSRGSTRRAPRSAALAGGVSDTAIRAGRQALADRPADGRGGKRDDGRRDDGRRVGSGRGPAGNDAKDRPTATAPSHSRRPARKPSPPKTSAT